MKSSEVPVFQVHGYNVYGWNTPWKHQSTIYSRRYIIHVMQKLLKLFPILIWLDSFPLLSQRTWTVHYYPISHTFPFNRLQLFFSESRGSENWFCCLFSGSLGWSWVIIRIENIVAAFQGMHVSPAKHSYAWLPRKCDYQESVTTGQTDRQTPDKVIPVCLYASQATQ